MSVTIRPLKIVKRKLRMENYFLACTTGALSRMKAAHLQLLYDQEAATFWIATEVEAKGGVEPGLAIPSKTPGMKDLVEETKDFKIKAGVLTIKGKFKVKVTDAASNFLRAKDFLIEFIDDTIWLMTEDEKEEIDTEVNKAKDATPEEKEKIEDSLADKLVAEPIKIPGLAKFINAKPEPTM